MTLKMMDMSTWHVSKETAALLDADNAGAVAYPKGGYGWFVSAINYKEYANEIPSDLLECLAFAETASCDWLCLDRDGTVYPELPKYRWQDN